MTPKEIKIEVVKAYLHSKEYLQSNTTDDKLVEKARSFVFDVQQVASGVTKDMSDTEVADLYVLHGLYPVTTYFGG